MGGWRHENPAFANVKRILVWRKPRYELWKNIVVDCRPRTSPTLEMKGLLVTPFNCVFYAIFFSFLYIYSPFLSVNQSHTHTQTHSHTQRIHTGTILDVRRQSFVLATARNSICLWFFQWKPIFIIIYFEITYFCCGCFCGCCCCGCCSTIESPFWLLSVDDWRMMVSGPALCDVAVCLTASAWSNNREKPNIICEKWCSKPRAEKWTIDPTQSEEAKKGNIVYTYMIWIFFLDTWECIALAFSVSLSLTVSMDSDGTLWFDRCHSFYV